MANKLLKSITFPDLTDKYIIGDTTLSVSGAGADSKTVGDALATKADNDGSYSNMTVGNAEQLVSNVKVNDKTPYLFRTSGGSVDIGDREYVNGIVGGTVAWNQLLTASEGTAKTTQYAGMMPDVNINVINEHKYLLSFLQPAGCRVYSQSVTNLTVGSKSYPAPTADTLQGKIVTATATALTYMGSIISKSETTETAYKLTECMFIDLTQMFGSTIADYIYSLEQSTAGAGVAWFRKLFNKPYYAYNAGELKSVSGLVSHDMTGFNQFDKDRQNVFYGYIDTAYHTYKQGTEYKAAYIPCIPNTTYTISKEAGKTFRVASSEDAPANDVPFINTYANHTGSIITFTTASTARYLTVLYWSSANGDTKTADQLAETLCINITWDGSRDGEYEPYELHSYPLDSDLTLRGIPKLDANNSLYYDGDVYAPSGEVTRKYGIVNLGSLTGWDKISTTGGHWRFYVTYDLAKTVASASALPNYICNKYETIAANYSWAGTKSGIASQPNGVHTVIMVNDENYTDVTAFKTAMNGVYLVYELATPTTETADPYVGTQIVNDFGTEEYVISDNTFAVPVGHDTDYPINLVAKLEMAPNSPEGNGDYIVRQVNGENSYVPLVIEDALPTIPSTAGSYKLTVTVAEGSDPVLSWEAE